MQLNPALKSLAEEEKTFQTAAPMLFGEEFAKRATNKVEVVKAIKKLSRPGEQHRKQDRVSITNPELITQMVVGVGTVAVSRQNWTPIAIGPMGPFLTSELDPWVQSRWTVFDCTVKVGPPSKLDPPVTTKHQEYVSVP